MLVADDWAAGRLPVWNPYAYSGTPLLANGETGALYPPNLLFHYLPPAHLYNWVLVANLVLAGAGAALLALRLCCDRLGAVVAGTGFALCGFMFGHISHPTMLASAAWLPWAILGFELLRERVTSGRLLLAGGSLALTLIAGHSQMFALALWVIAVYALVVAVREWRAGGRRALALGALTIAAGAALAAVQLLPTVSIVGETLRSSVSFSEATSYSFPPSHLALLPFPYLFGNLAAVSPYDVPYHGAWNLVELAGYPGLGLAVFAAAGLGAVRRDARALALVVVAAVALVLALGDATPAGRLIYELPVYGHFRAWARNVLALDLAVALLAAYGVRLLRADATRRAAYLRAAACAGAVVIGAVVVPRVGPAAKLAVSGRAGVAAVAVPALAAVVAAACAAGLGARRYARAAAVVACLLVVADPLASFGGTLVWRAVPRFDAGTERYFGREQAPPWGTVQDAPGGIDRYLIANYTFVHQTDVKHMRSVNGDDPLAPRRYAQAVGDMSFVGTMARPADVLGPASHVRDLLRVSTVLTARGTRIVRTVRQPRLADAFLVGQARSAPRRAVLDSIHGRRPFDPSRTALVEGPCGQCPAGAPPGSGGDVTAARFSPSSVDVRVRARRPAVLVVSQADFPGWSARVDGHSARLMRADGVLTGVALPAGAHHVEMTYRAPGLRLGAAISALALLALAVWAAIRRFGAGAAWPRRRAA